MRSQIGFAGISLILLLGGCASRTAGETTVNGGQTSAGIDGGVPSKRHGLIVPSDPPMGISGSQSTTGTESGRIDDSMGKGVSGGSPP
jgi:hypothetical protein